MSRAHHFWTDAREEQLRQLTAHPDRYSATQIASVFGVGVSRCMIIGKAIRLGLSIGKGRVYVAKPKAPPKDRVVRPKSIARAPEPEEPPVDLDAAWVPPPRTTPLERLRATDCRFPFGDPRAEDFGFCGAPIRPGSVYCRAHHALCYTQRRAA